MERIEDLPRQQTTNQTPLPYRCVAGADETAELRYGREAAEGRRCVWWWWRRGDARAQVPPKTPRMPSSTAARARAAEGRAGMRQARDPPRGARKDKAGMKRWCSEAQYAGKERAARKERQAGKRVVMARRCKEAKI